MPAYFWNNNLPINHFQGAAFNLVINYTDNQFDLPDLKLYRHLQETLFNGLNGEYFLENLKIILEFFGEDIT